MAEAVRPGRLIIEIQFLEAQIESPNYIDNQLGVLFGLVGTFSHFFSLLSELEARVQALESRLARVEEALQSLLAAEQLRKAGQEQAQWGRRGEPHNLKRNTKSGARRCKGPALGDLSGVTVLFQPENGERALSVSDKTTRLSLGMVASPRIPLPFRPTRSL